MGNTRRVFLWTVVGALALSALLGIWVVVFGSFLGVEGEVFGTLGTLVLFSLPGLLAASMLERRHWVLVNRAGLAVAVAGVGLFLLVIWFDAWSWLHDDWLWRSMFLATTWAWALPWGAALGLARLDGALGWVRRGSIGFVYAFAALLSVLIVLIDGGDTEWFARLLAVVGILAALGTLVTPILHRVAGAEREAGVESTPLELWLRCPRCLMEQTVAAGVSRCGRCRLRFTIEIEEPRCPKCRFLLHRLTEPRCPECGEALGPDEVGAG